MIGDLSALRDSLLAARLLREQVFVAPVAPDVRPRLRTWFLHVNGRAPACRPALETALARARSGPLVAVSRADLESLAAACGGAALRSRPGVPFLGRPAPGADEVPGLLDELLESVNRPAAVEGWPPPARAFALHFLLRLVQPFQAPAVAVGHAAEALLLAADGFEADLMFLPRLDVGETGERPDPEAFVRERTEALAGRVGESLLRVRDAAALEVLIAWSRRPAARLNPRQESLISLLAKREHRLTFQEYVSLHAGRRAPSLRSLQRDWQALRERGLLVEAGDDAFVLSTDPVAFGARDLTG